MNNHNYIQVILIITTIKIRLRPTTERNYNMSLWNQCLERLRQELPTQQFVMWIRPLTSEQNQDAAPGPNSSESSSSLHNNANILEDIYMDLSVEIGRAKIKISELLELKAGSIIELAQKTDEPLSIFANDKLIAQGHIVSSNGKYSIKII